MTKYDLIICSHFKDSFPVNTIKKALNADYCIQDCNIF